MENGTGINGPIMLLSFVGGFGAALTHVINPILAAVFVGVLAKAVDAFIKSWWEHRKNFWRKVALRYRRRVKELERRRY